MKVSLLRILSEGVQQPPDYDKIVFGGYRDYILEIEGWPDAGSVRQIVVASRMLGGGISLRDWKFEQQDGKDVLHIYFSANLLGHDLDQWATYDLETGARIDIQKMSKASPPPPQNETRPSFLKSILTKFFTRH